MHGAAALSNLDTVLLMAPFATLLVLGLFRMDEGLAGRRNGRRNRFCEVDPDGHGNLLDPDGRCPKGPEACGRGLADAEAGL